MNIRVEKITLYFYPANRTVPIRDGSSTYVFNYSDCDIELKIVLNKKNNIKIEQRFVNVSYDIAKEIYECSNNKSLALLNVNSKNESLSNFCKLKTDNFCDEKPITNWKQYEIWCELKKQEQNIIDKIKSAETLIWKKGEKSDKENNKYKDLYEEIMKNAPPIQDPIQTQPQFPPYKPIWVDHTGNPNYINNDRTFSCNSASDVVVNMLNQELPKDDDIKNVDLSYNNFSTYIKGSSNFTIL